MTTLSKVQMIELHAQHTLQADDWMLICKLANVEGFFEQAASWRFEQFFGFTVYLFVTTESASDRQQLAHLISKCGSQAVLSLVRILHHAHYSNDLPAGFKGSDLAPLALKSLEEMKPYTLVLGLIEVLEHADAAELMPTIVKALVKVIHEDSGAVLSLLPQLVPADIWQTLKAKMLQDPSFPTVRVTAEGARSIQTHTSETTPASYVR